MIRLVLVVALDTGALASAYAGRFLLGGALLAFGTIALLARRKRA